MKSSNRDRYAVIRVVVFDFDGTLVDSNAIKRRCLDEVVAELPGGAEALAHARATGGDRYRMCRTLARRLKPAASPAEIADFGQRLAADYTRRCLAAIGAAPERRGAHAALRALRRRGVKIWINSATPRRDLPALLRARRIHSYVHGALGAPRNKVQNLQAIMAAERAAPGQLLMIGDGLDDQAAAKQLGTWFVGITAERAFDRRPAYVMPDLTRLPDLVPRLASAR